MASRVEALALRVQADPYFMAQALADYQSSEGLDEAGLATCLGCSAGELSALRLCRRPRGEPALFRQDIERIASRFRIYAEVIAEAVRRSDALQAMRHTGEDERGLLMVARDRENVDANDADGEGDPS